jgi:hypothetical protein
MTPKQELLNYINENVTDIDYLFTYEMFPTTLQKGTKVWITKKQEVLDIITNRFGDELIGFMPNSHLREIMITSWTLLPHEEPEE